MTKERELTRCESFGLTQGLTKTLHDWDQSQNHPVIGKVGSRVIGVIATPITAVIDTIAHLILFGAKLAIAAALLPYNFIATVFVPSIALPKDLEISSSLIHLTRAAESVIGVVSLPVLCFFDPGRAYALANHNNYNPGTMKTGEKNPPEVEKTAASKKRKRSSEVKTKKASTVKKAKAESKEDLKALLAEVEKNSQALDQQLEKSGKKPLHSSTAGSDTTPVKEVDRADYISDEFDGIYVDTMLDESVDTMLDELDALAAEIEAYKQMSTLSGSVFDNLDLPPEELEAAREKEPKVKGATVNAFAGVPLDSLDTGFDEVDPFDAKLTTYKQMPALSGSLLDELDVIADELDAIDDTDTVPPKPKSDFKFEKTPEPEPKKLNLKEGEFSLLAASLKQKSNLADKLKKAKSKPGLSELVPEAVKQVKTKIEANKNESAAATQQTQAQFVKEHEEKVKKLKPVFGGVMEELKARSAEILEKSKKAADKASENKESKQADVVFSDLNFKARKKLLQEMGSIDKVNEFLSGFTKEEAALLYGLQSGADEVIDQGGLDTDSVELNSNLDFNLNLGGNNTALGGNNIAAAQTVEETIVEADQISFDAPALFMREGEAIIRFFKDRNWTDNADELEEKRQEMLNMLSSVRRFNREWNLKSSLPSPYAAAEKKLYELATFIEMDRNAILSGFGGSGFGAIVVFGARDDEGQEVHSILGKVEEASHYMISINLLDKEIQENPQDWETGLNSRRYLLANQTYMSMQRLALENNLGHRLREFLKEAEDKITLITTKTEDEILALPLAEQSALEPENLLPFSSGLMAEIEEIRQGVQEGAVTQNEALLRMKTLYSLWKSQGADLEEAVEDLEMALSKADKALYLEGPVAGSAVVKEGVKALQVIRASALKMRDRTFETLDAKHHQRKLASQAAMGRLKTLQAANEDETEALEKIFQEAYSYTLLGYADLPFRTENAIDAALGELEREGNELSEEIQASDKQQILSLYAKAVAYSAQWDYEESVMTGKK